MRHQKLELETRGYLITSASHSGAQSARNFKNQAYKYNNEWDQQIQNERNETDFLSLAHSSHMDINPQLQRKEPQTGFEHQMND